MSYDDNGYDNRYDDRYEYDDRYDYRYYDDTFEVDRIDAEWYYGNRDEIEFEVTIDLENNTNDDITFDIQDFSIFAPRSLTSRDYDWYVEEVDCD